MSTVWHIRAGAPARGLQAKLTPRRFAAKPFFARMAMVITIPWALAGCAAIAAPEPHMPAVSVEHLEYYSGEVKGYQKTYPESHILVLPPIDRRQLPVLKDLGGPGLGVPGEGTEVGIVSDHNGVIIQRIYAPPIESVVQSALAKSAKEAGLVPTLSNQALESALHRTDEDYVLASQITNYWALKRPIYDPIGDQTIWVTAAVFALDVQIYKPPFHVAFWEGRRAISYSDPPLTYGLDPVDSVAMYDRPGQVLSVAVTRAVAGLFADSDLHELIAEDSGAGRRRGLGIIAGSGKAHGSF